MDAVKFLKEKERMCEYYEGKECLNLCPCALDPDAYDYCGNACNDISYAKLVEVVKDWSEKNPVGTNRMKFKEVFGCELSLTEIVSKECAFYIRRDCVNFKENSRPCPDCPWWDEPFSEC